MQKQQETKKAMEVLAKQKKEETEESEEESPKQDDEDQNKKIERILSNEHQSAYGDTEQACLSQDPSPVKKKLS